MVASLRMADALALMAKRTSRRRAGTDPCPPAIARALRLRAQKALPLAALVDRLLAAPRLARLARGLPVALAGLLLAAEPVGPPRLALVVKALQRRRF